jgi:hypothetical protein
MGAGENLYCIAFGIPTTREEFFQSFSPPVSDYTRHWLGGWGQYRTQFVADLETVTPDLKQAGVAIVRRLRLEELAGLFAKYRVVVLFSHWTADGIEFFDGMASTERILPQIPSTYDGVFDLCVCHPVGLVQKLLAQRPRYFVKYVQHEAAPHYWLYFYRDIFGYMHTSKSHYLDAFEVIFKAHIAMIRRHEDRP